jgi:hypothetical protein
MTTDASWAPAQGGIYFIDNNGSGSSGRLSFFNFATWHVQKLAELEGSAGFG